MKNWLNYGLFLRDFPTSYKQKSKMNIKETENNEKNASDMTSRCLRKNKTINSIKLEAKRDAAAAQMEPS